MNFNVHFEPTKDNEGVTETNSNETVSVAELLAAVMERGGQESLAFRAAFDAIVKNRTT